MIKGDLNGISAEDLIQLIFQANKRGTLNVISKSGPFRLYFNRQEIYHAYSPHYTHGKDAVMEFFLVHEGTFEFVEGEFTDKYISVAGSMFDIISEGIQVREELSGIFSQVNDETTFDVLQMKENGSVSFSSKEFAILRLIGEGRQSKEIMKEAEIEFFAFLRILKRFINQNIVVIKKEVIQEPPKRRGILGR
ncbi:MAG: DUF4388 domain-containing protein [Caldisericaceae bacterium]